VARRFKIGEHDIVLVSHLMEGVPEWTYHRMMRIARARDNQGPWFVASSTRTPKDLERLFRQREVASLLEETVGGIVGGFDVTPRGAVHIQIDYGTPRDLELILLCLSEIGIEIDAPLFGGRGGTDDDE